MSSDLLTTLTFDLPFKVYLFFQYLRLKTCRFQFNAKWKVVFDHIVTFFKIFLLGNFKYLKFF